MLTIDLNCERRRSPHKASLNRHWYRTRLCLGTEIERQLDAWWTACDGWLKHCLHTHLERWSVRRFYSTGCHRFGPNLCLKCVSAGSVSGFRCSDTGFRRQVYRTFVVGNIFTRGGLFVGLSAGLDKKYWMDCRRRISLTQNRSY